MNHPETVKLLALMAAMDRRTIGDAEVMAWQSVLEDVEYADAAEAVRRHYRDSEDYLMPVHVRRGAAEVYAERTRPKPSPWAPGQFGVPKDEAHPEITDRIGEGSITSAEVRRVVAEVSEMLRERFPEASREALMPRRVYWEKEHGACQRAQQAQPNPLYRPGRVTRCGCGPEHGPTCPLRPYGWVDRIET